MAVEDEDTMLAAPHAQQIVPPAQREIALATLWRLLGPPRIVRFPVANTPIEVPHGLGLVPDGMQLGQWDATIIRTPGRVWTTELAYLQSSAVNTECVVAFGMFREEAVNVQASA